MSAPGLLWLLTAEVLAADLELALLRFEAARAEADALAMREEAAAALAAAPEDWRAHAAWHAALAERPWWLAAEFAALQASDDPELAFLGAWGEARGAHRLPPPAPEADPALVAGARARSALDLGQPELVLADLPRGQDPVSTALRLEALWVAEDWRALRAEAREALELWPDHPELGAWLWRGGGVEPRLARREALALAERALASGDAVALYRAHALFLAAEEPEQAAAAARALAALGEPHALGSRSPWTASMVRDLGRVLSVHRVPHPPPGGTAREDARVLASVARAHERAGRPERAADAWRLSVAAADDDPGLLLRAAASLEATGAPPEEVLDLCARARALLAVSPGLGPELNIVQHGLAESWRLEALALRRAGRAQEALLAATVAVQIEANPDGLALRARLLDELGQTEAAVDAWLHAASAGAELPPATRARLFTGPATPEALIAAMPERGEGRAGPPRRPEGPPRFPVEALSTNQGPVALGQGEVVVITFWASWCGPCAAELPALDALAARLRDEGLPVRIVAISLDDDEGAASRWLRSHPVGLPVGWEPPLGRLLGVVSLPTTWVVDGDGVVRSRHQGYEPGDEAHLEAELRVILQEGRAAP